MNYLFITLGEFGIKEIILVMIILIVPYFLPTIIAFSKNRSNKVPIMLINLLLGWSGIGWLGSLIWACMPDKENTTI